MADETVHAVVEVEWETTGSCRFTCRNRAQKDKNSRLPNQVAKLNVGPFREQVLEIPNCQEEP